MAAQPSSTTTGKQSFWDKTKARTSSLFNKAGKPVNKASNKLGAEAFWPQSLDHEADKAAKILRSFCLDGFHADEKKGSLEHIPADAIRNCKGLAIFTVMRVGLHWSGAGGSGIVIEHLPDGSWSAPSGVLIHTLGWGFVAGADIYDCVAVINNEAGMESFTRVRATLGGEVSAAVGPLGGGSMVEAGKREAVWTYTKSKGLYVGVQVDGTVVVERRGENERFYGVKGIKNQQILSGEVKAPSGSMVQLWETLQAAEGKSHDVAKLPAKAATPGDQQVEGPRTESEKEYAAKGGYYPEERMDYKA